MIQPVPGPGPAVPRFLCNCGPDHYHSLTRAQQRRSVVITPRSLITPHLPVVVVAAVQIFIRGGAV